MHQHKHKIGDYKHDLRNYVYYSEQIKEGNIDIIIRYTLDNYVAVSGTIGDDYVTRAGYLIDLYDVESTDANINIEDIDMETVEEIKYKDIIIETEEIEEYTGPVDENGTNKKSEQTDKTAIAYYKEAYEFTDWFMNETGIGKMREYLSISGNNDPEDQDSAFVQHKKEIIKEKIEETLNSSITAYANKTGNNYKMPRFTEEDWAKVYNNISVISFVQGMNIGFKTYNNYCILSSTNNQEYVNPNLIYFTDGNSYHDIRCEEIISTETTGYKIGSFEKQTYEYEEETTAEDGSTTTETKTGYYYKHNELACYECINGTVNNNQSVYDYVRDTDDVNVKKSYFSALARERYKTTKLLNSYNAEYTQKCTITFDEGYSYLPENATVSNMPVDQTVNIGQTIVVPPESPEATGYNFGGWMVNGEEDNTIVPGVEGAPYTAWGDTTLVAKWEAKKYTVTFNSNGGTTTPEPQTVAYGGTATKPADPTKTGHNFEYWYILNEDGSMTEYDFDKEVTSDITLYAKWDIITCTVTYFIDENRKETTPIEYGTILERPSDPSRDNYNFVGWYTNTNYDNEYIFDQPITGDTNIYADWIQIEKTEQEGATFTFIFSKPVSDVQIKYHYDKPWLHPFDKDDEGFSKNMYKNYGVMQSVQNVQTD